MYVKFVWFDFLTSEVLLKLSTWMKFWAEDYGQCQFVNII